jgi:tRNA 2-thiocytidine biosynthesis protein TtcA
MVEPINATTITPPKALLRPVGRAIADYNMVQPGDKILVAVSGGKDSLTLLHVLLHLKRHAPVNFDVAAITVDPQVEGYDPSHLKDYMQSLGVKFFYQSQPIMQRAVDHMGKASYCSFCSRMKRGIMYATARREGYNVLALGQHLDDLAESFLMSAFHGGQLRTMKAHYVNDDGDLRVIRPLLYTRERQTAAYAKECALPVVADSCPACFQMPTQRQHMKDLLAAEEKHNRNLFKNLLTTMRPLLNQEYYVRASDVKVK